MENESRHWSESSAKLYRALDEAGVDPDSVRHAAMSRPNILRDRVSQCCRAPLGIAGDGTTHWYACGKCGEPTDPV